MAGAAVVVEVALVPVVVGGALVVELDAAATCSVAAVPLATAGTPTTSWSGIGMANIVKPGQAGGGDCGPSAVGSALRPVKPVALSAAEWPHCLRHTGQVK